MLDVQNGTCVNSYTVFMYRHSYKLTVTYFLVMSVFIAVMTDSYFAEVRAIVGYSALAAHVVMGLMYIPYRQEMKRIRAAVAASLPAPPPAFNPEARWKELEAERTAADNEIRAMFGKQEDYTLIDQGRRDVTDLKFDPAELTHAKMYGMFLNPLLPKERMYFYVLKVRERANPAKVTALTFSQRNLTRGQMNEATWFCLTDQARGDIFDCDSYKLTGDQFKNQLRALLDGTHTTHELAS